MNWIDRAEQKFGHLAIPGLWRFIIGLNLLTFIVCKLEPNYLQFLRLDRPIDRVMVLQGQVWRLVTFLFLPSFGGLLETFWLICYLLFIGFVGSGLEQAMGSFRLNLYYLLGALGIIVSGFLFGGAFGNGLLNTTLLFAFARFYPDAMIYIMFVLPAKVKWVVWLTAAMLIFQFVISGWDFRMSLLGGFLNYWIFFAGDLIRDARDRQQVASRRSRFRQQADEGQSGALHQCVVCKRTDETSPELEFRVARDGEEYCREHLPKRTEGK